MESIIVYRNPIEKMFWEGELGPIVVGCVAGFFAFIAAFWFMDKFFPMRGFSFRVRNRVHLTVAFASAIAMGFLGGYLTFNV